jgi:hypothetical protein
MEWGAGASGAGGGETKKGTGGEDDGGGEVRRRTPDFKKNAAILLCCLVASGVFPVASPSFCSGGILAHGARAAGMGGVRIVGDRWSPFTVASCPGEGLLLQVSWANPYGISDLDAGRIGLRYGWMKASSAVSIGFLQTPTPFREAHIAGSVSFEAAEGLVLGAEAAHASLIDDEGSFAGESSVSLGAVFSGCEWLEVGCAVETPIGAASEGIGSGGGSRHAAFVWGLGVPAVDGVVFVMEEDRRDGWVSRKVGGEISWPGVMAVRAGVSDSPFTVCLGVGVRTGKTRLDAALVEHEALGITPHATISYSTFRGRKGAPVTDEKQPRGSK